MERDEEVGEERGSHWNALRRLRKRRAPSIWPIIRRPVFRRPRMRLAWKEPPWRFAPFPEAAAFALGAARRALIASMASRVAARARARRPARYRRRATRQHAARHRDHAGAAPASASAKPGYYKDDGPGDTPPGESRRDSRRRFRGPSRCTVSPTVPTACSAASTCRRHRCGRTRSAASPRGTGASSTARRRPSARSTTCTR